MKGRRRAVVLSAGAAVAALSIFASVGAAGSMGRLTAEIWPNAIVGDGTGVLPTDSPPIPGDPSATCAGLGDGSNNAPSVPVDPSAAAPAPGDPTAGCPSDVWPNVPGKGDIWPNGPLPGDTLPNSPLPGDTLPNGSVPDGNPGGVPLL